MGEKAGIVRFIFGDWWGVNLREATKMYLRITLVCLGSILVIALMAGGFVI